MKGIENLKKVVTWCTELVDEIFKLIEKKQGKKITGFVTCLLYSLYSKTTKRLEQNG